MFTPVGGVFEAKGRHPEKDDIRMKLRFHNNSLRFRLNQLEVHQLASGQGLAEEIWFPLAAQPFRYALRVHEGAASAELEKNEILVSLNRADIAVWAASEELELHRSIPTAHDPLKLMVEKDLVCVDRPEQERDPHAYPRAEQALCK